jgi:hemolysin activation/secretion protein
MSALSDRIAARARERGFIFANAVISPQSLSSGVLRVSLDEGVIDEIRIEGDADPAILSQLEPLRDGRPVTLARLERHILLADDISGIRLRSPRYEREGERGVLIVEARRDRFSGRAELANDGSQPIGPLRARIDFDANGLISPFDEIDFTYSTVPTEPGELQYLAGRYSVVVSPQGTEVSFGASYSATHPGAYLADRAIRCAVRAASRSGWMGNWNSATCARTVSARLRATIVSRWRASVSIRGRSCSTERSAAA